jgi:hypothetical protein
MTFRKFIKHWKKTTTNLWLLRFFSRIGNCIKPNIRKEDYSSSCEDASHTIWNKGRPVGNINLKRSSTNDDNNNDYLQKTVK